MAEILSSDGLDIDSEMEIALAAENWLLHNFNERSGFARLLLLKVRLPLLSVAALNRLKNKPCFGANCSGVIDDVIRENIRSSPLGTTIRYCNQHRFDVIVSGGLVYGEVVSDVYEVGANSFEIRNYPKLKTERHYSEMLCLRGELYVFGGLDAARQPITSVERYSPRANAWENVAEMLDDRKRFCAASFMGDAYVMGGNCHECWEYVVNTGSCAKFNSESGAWEEAAPLNVARSDAAAAVFQGRLVACGGVERAEYLSSVEAYDRAEDAWTRMPDMVKGRKMAKLVGARNKLFACGGFCKTSFEVFDSTCGKFVLLNAPGHWFDIVHHSPATAVTVGSNLVVFYNYKNAIVTYDLENGGWRVESCGFRKSLEFYSCAKLPHFKLTTISNSFL